MIKQKCKQCGKEFELSDSEIKFYKDKGLTLPKRCEDCRKANKAQKEENAPQSGKPNRKNGKKAGAIAAAAVIAAGLFAGHGALSNNSNNQPAPVPETQSEIVVNANQEQNTDNFVVNTNENAAGSDEQAVSPDDNTVPEETQYHFRNEKTLREHFQKHGGEFNGLYSTREEYESGASRVINDPSALNKREKEDNDYVYYLEDTNEFVILSEDGYIRTYFKPNAGKKYYDRQ